MHLRLALAAALLLTPMPAFDVIAGGQAGASESAAIPGLVHETKPSAETVLADVRIQVEGGASSGQIYTTGADGRFTLPFASGGFALQFTKPGYEPVRIEVKQPPAALDVAMRPGAREVSLTRSGANACTDLPRPPEGVPGLREYARIAVHHDGQLVVRAAQLPFFGNQGYLYRRTENGWEKNELDYILVRTPLPVRGGFEYVIAFGGDKDQCGPWSLDATHPR
jgi:hypothetical protein